MSLLCSCSLDQVWQSDDTEFYISLILYIMYDCLSTDIRLNRTVSGKLTNKSMAFIGRGLVQYVYDKCWIHLYELAYYLRPLRPKTVWLFSYISISGIYFSKTLYLNLSCRFFRDILILKIITSTVTVRYYDLSLMLTSLIADCSSQIALRKECMVVY